MIKVFWYSDSRSPKSIWQGMLFGGGMCGITGYISTDSEISIGRLEKTVAVLAHRGPDGHNCWLSPDRLRALGHARLSIIDLEGGVQPLHNEDNSIHAVVNGELYDFEKIRAGLEQKGHRFRTASDSEILIHLYEDKGERCLEDLRGEFAFIIQDDRTGRLFAARDRFGIKPLYYSQKGNAVFLASEIKALLAAGVPAEWDAESLYISTFFGGIPLIDRTFFKSVYQLKPGHYLTASDGQVRIQKYWDFHYAPAGRNGAGEFDENEATLELRDRFDEAVKLRLRADVPVGVYLSGGIDSCSILGTVAKLRGEGTKAFTISFNDEDYDEYDVAREMAESTGTEFNSYKITPEQLAGNFLDCIWYGESLLINPHSVAKYILSSHVRDAGYKVVLTGEGSDEIFGGYAHFRQDLLLYDEEYRHSGTQDALSRLKKGNKASSGLLISPSNRKYVNAFEKELGFTPSWLLPMIDGAGRGKPFRRRNRRNGFAHIDPYGMYLDSLDIKNEVKDRPVLHQSLYLWSKLLLPNYLLSNLGDRMEMGHSVEGRVPFLDHKLVEFVSSLPASFKIRGLTEKYVLREAMKPVLSKNVYERQKHPFMAPPMAGNRKDALFLFLRDYISDTIDGVPGVNGQGIKKLLKFLPVLPEKTRRMLDPVLMVVASMAALQDRFGLSN